MAYRNTLQADALKLVAKKMQSSLAVEGELPEDGLAAYGDDGDDLMMALARKIVSGEEEDEAETVESVFAQARDAEASAEEYLVDDDWKAVEIGPEAVAVNSNCPVLAYGHHGNGHHARRHRADGRAGPGQRARARKQQCGDSRQRQRTPRRRGRRSRSSRSSPGPSSWPKSR